MDERVGDLDPTVACLILAKKSQRVEQGTERGKEISIPYFKMAVLKLQAWGPVFTG